MIAIFRKWRDKRRAEEFNTGYSWAAGHLLRTRGDTLAIEGFVDAARTFGTFTAFDTGALTALSDWRDTFKQTFGDPV